MAENKQDSINFEINFGEGVSEDGRLYEPQAPRERTGGTYRALKSDGLYKVRARAIEGDQSQAGNYKLRCTFDVLDEDEKGATLFHDVVVSGKTKPFKDATSGKEVTQPNIWKLMQMLMSFGRTKEELDTRVKSGVKTDASTLAGDLTTEGRNVGYVRVRHEVQTQGKNAGKERPNIAAFILQNEYDTSTSRRWDKKLEMVAPVSGNGTTPAIPADQMADLLKSIGA